MWPFDDIGNLFSGSSMPSAGGLTPDQQQMLQQQGWYPRPDMVLPTGQNLQQPPGYSNLTPAQASTVNNLGYFTGTAGDTGQSQSLWDKLKAGLGDPNTQSALKNAMSGLGPGQPLSHPPLSQPPLPHMGGFNPYRSMYRPPVLDPKTALQTLMRGY